MNKLIVPVRIITDLIIFTVAALELKDKINKARMRKQHATHNDQHEKG
jgi:hypothetical protein